MYIEKQIKILSIKTGYSISEIGRRLDRSPQAFSQKIKRGRFSLDDLMDIALATGCGLRCEFVLPDGERIGICEVDDDKIH